VKVPGFQRSKTPSFEELYRDHSAAVYRYCHHLCGGNVAEAQDVAQEALILAFRGLGKFEGRASVLTWLLRIARRVWLRRRERRHDSVPLDAVADLADPTLGVETTQVTRLWLAEALQRLPAHMHEALLLVKVEGLTYREAAEVLGIPQGTVQFHVREALRITRDFVAEARGGSSILAVLALLTVGRELRAAVMPPPGLADRVFAEINQGRDPGYSPPVVRQMGAGNLNVSPRVVRVTLGAAAAIALVPLVPSIRSYALMSKGPRREAHRVVEALSRARSAHAIGVATIWTRDRDGSVSSGSSRLEYWYEAPDKYTRHSLPAQGRSRTVLNGKRAEIIADRGKRGLAVIPSRPEILLRSMGAFALFGIRSPLVQALNNPQSVVSATSESFNGVAAKRLIVTLVESGHRYSWNVLTSESGSSVIRSETIDEWLVAPIATTRSQTVIETFEINSPVPSNSFTFPD